MQDEHPAEDVENSTESLAGNDLDKDPPGVQTVVESVPIDHSGTTVHVKGWILPNNENPPVVIVHDFGENITYYRAAARHFVAHGYSVFCFDLRGHGRSGRMLGYIESFNELISDLLQVASWVRHKSKGVAPIIVGQGIGALITIYFQLKYPRLCQAAVLSSPSLKLRYDISRMRRFLIRRMSDVLPRVRLPKSLTPRLNTPPQYGEGSFIHSIKTPSMPAMSAKLAGEILRAIDWAPGRFLKFSTNTLILYPGNDKLYTYDALDQLLSRHKYADKIQVQALPEASHNSLTEDRIIVKKEVDIIVEWLKETL